jgi:type IV secretory pathway VirB10-like protein
MRGHDDDGFERLLRGDTPGTPAERKLGAFVDDLREAFPAQPLLAGDVHLAQITEAARLLADKGDPVARPVSNAAVREGHASGLPKRRGTIMRVPVWKSLAARVVAGLVVLMSMFGGMAFAGALPGGIQDKVANAVAAVVDIQSANDEVTTEEPETEEPAEPAETESPDPDETEDPVETQDQADSEADDQGEDADDQGEDESATESDDQGEDADDQGEDGDDQGEDESESTETETETESNDQDDDTQDATETEDQDQNENE